MIPNHVFQLVAMTAMEAPNSFRADAVRSEKAKVIEAIRICRPEEVPCTAVRGQYGPGKIGAQDVPGYRRAGRPATSEVETYAAMKLTIDNWRWAGVAFSFERASAWPNAGR